MLSHLEIHNFKRLQKISLDLSKVNIFVGPNGAGKSSVIQLLALLKQTLPSRDGIHYNGQYVELGTFRDVAYKHRKRRSIHVSLDFKLSDIGTLTLRDCFEGIERLQVKKSVPRKSRTLRCELSWKENRFTKQSISIDNLLLITGSQRGKKLESDFLRGDVEVNENPSVMLSWLGGGPSDLVNELYIFSQCLRALVSKEFDNFYPLFVTRGFTRYSYSLSRVEPNEISDRDIEKVGSKTANVLVYKRVGGPGYTRQLSKVNEWASEFGFRVRPRLHEEYTVRVEGRDSQFPIYSNMVLQGFGASQLLPVIVQGFTLPLGGMLAVEEPEIHLHPKYQAKLVDLFFDIAGNDRQVLITSHSEHLVLRLQRRVAEGAIKPKDFTLYYFDNSEGDTTVTRIEVDKYGNLETWPPGFFEEGFEESLAHLKASLKKARRERKE